MLNLQVGWQKCTACSDYKRIAGRMWLGNHFISCPACHGTGQVPLLKTIDPRTGREINYEGV